MITRFQTTKVSAANRTISPASSDRPKSLGSRAATLRQQMSDARLAARAYTREHGEDDPAITGWTWPGSD